MNKIGLMEIAQRYNMEFARNEITREGYGVYGTYSAAVPDLDKIIDNNELPVVGRRTYDADSVTYTIFCPRAWIDLWGWC